MDQLDDWLRKIGDGEIDGVLHSEIAGKILELLEQKKESLDTREKILFARAVIGLSTSVNSIYQPNEAGLRRCVIALGEVMIPQEVLDDSFEYRHDEAMKISHSRLVTTVEIIKRQIV